MADLLSKLRDLDSPESRIAQSLATGAFTVLVSPRRLSSRGLAALHAASGLTGGAATARILGSKASPQQRAIVAGATGVAIYGASVVGFAADAAAEGWLRRRGVRHPRVWMGLVAAVATWATSAPSREEQPEVESDAVAEDEGPAAETTPTPTDD